MIQGKNKKEEEERGRKGVIFGSILQWLLWQRKKKKKEDIYLYTGKGGRRTGHQSFCQRPKAVLREGSRFTSWRQSQDHHIHSTGMWAQGQHKCRIQQFRGPSRTVGPTHKAWKQKALGYSGETSQGVEVLGCDHSSPHRATWMDPFSQGMEMLHAR